MLDHIVSEYYKVIDYANMLGSDVLILYLEGVSERNISVFSWLYAHSVFILDLRQAGGCINVWQKIPRVILDCIMRAGLNKGICYIIEVCISQRIQ